MRPKKPRDTADAHNGKHQNVELGHLPLNQGTEERSGLAEQNDVQGIQCSGLCVHGKVISSEPGLFWLSIQTRAVIVVDNNGKNRKVWTLGVFCALHADHLPGDFECCAISAFLWKLWE